MESSCCVSSPPKQLLCVLVAAGTAVSSGSPILSGVISHFIQKFLDVVFLCGSCCIKCSMCSGRKVRDLFFPELLRLHVPLSRL
jgi:hypothetical protein